MQFDDGASKKEIPDVDSVEEQDVSSGQKTSHKDTEDASDLPDWLKDPISFNS